jgi:prolyl oligopeptidase
MRKSNAMKRHSLQLLFAGAVLLTMNSSLLADKIAYPETRKSDQIDDYHGVKVADPYRWLEDDRSPETEKWVRAENEATSAYLSRIPYRGRLFHRLEQLQNYARYSVPGRRGPWVFFRKNDGLQNQAVLYVQEGLKGTPRVLLDPNTFSKDGTTRLLETSPSRDGKYLAYATSAGGSDWEEAHVVEVATGKVLPDHIRWIKISELAWRGNGFFYSRYPEPQAGQELLSKNENHTVWYHRLGDPQSADELVYEDKAHPQRFNVLTTSEDEHYAILDVSDRGLGKDGNALYYRDLTNSDKTFHPIVGTITDDRYEFVDNDGPRFLINTNWKAPNQRIMAFDSSKSSDPWAEIVPEAVRPLTAASTAGGRLFVSYLQDVATHVYCYELKGKLQNQVSLPGPGIAEGFSGDRSDKTVFYSYTSLNSPATIYSYEVPSARSEVWRAPDIADFDPAKYETKEIFYPSKDGARIPMFLLYRKGLKLDGSNPTLLYGYGGFNIVNSPTFNALRLALVEQGFVYASANLRGGGEYGDAWHKAGMRLNKQNVFDDCIAAAEWLIKNHYTRPDKLALHGVSNGGLLVGAVINQRPDLFRAAVAQAGVMDMLRFQKFTIGWNWIADYGSSDNPQDFKNLYAYSPIHNVREGVRYPSVLITTADHDDRVVPGHSFKYAATMQAKVSPENPVLIRIDTNSGHGPSSTTKQLEQITDIYSFLMYNLGVTPDYGS